jgi:hypothetical protein
MSGIRDKASPTPDEVQVGFSDFGFLSDVGASDFEFQAQGSTRTVTVPKPGTEIADGAAGPVSSRALESHT